MSTITLSIEDEDLAFLREFSKTQGTSAEEFLARQARSLRKLLDRPLPPAVVAATGIIRSDVPARESHREWVERKQQ
jgi:hypothetical protein